MNAENGLDVYGVARPFSSPQPGSAVCGRVHWRDVMVGPGFDVLALFTIWVKVRAGAL